MLNTGDRPIQVRSHFHVADVNSALELDRATATGFRFDIPAGTSLRFDPGASRTVTLVALAGRRASPGRSCETYDQHRPRPVRRALRLDRPRPPAPGRHRPLARGREVEEDRCVGGDEAVFGGGKTIHESMLRGSRTASRGPDVVIMNVVVLDHRGVVRYDVGIREGRISALVKLANPTSPTACTPTSDRAHDDGPRDHRVCGEARSRKRRARSWRCSRRRRHDRRRCRRES